MAAVSLSYRATRQTNFKICFEEASCSSDTALSTDLRLTESEFDLENIHKAGSEYDAALVAFPAILNDYNEELSERDALIISGRMESHLNSETQETAQEIWHDICASQRKVLRLASYLLRFEDEFKADANMLSPKSYTVGWICTGMIEYAAAQALLDVRHKMPRNISPNDDNTYALGAIGKHNIVLTVVAGQGLSNAASVASGMKHSFPSIQFGLVVGIGGGAPSQMHDIRLGDVVVSVPCNGMGGVMQYDLGRTTEGQQFQPTGFINQPPYILQVAVTSLRAKYENDGNFIEETVTRILDESPRLREKYYRPEQNTDRLYQHDLGPHENEALCECDPVLRRERKPEEDKVAIHFGLVASGNLDMKDACVRDRLGSQNGVLCFETTAAGVMNHLPCLAINGVYNYSDSHRYIQWEGYAAITAAVYARELLSQIVSKDTS